jgi:hypothetical protein
MKERLKTLRLYLIAYPVEWISALLTVVAVLALLAIQPADEKVPEPKQETCQKEVKG